MSAVADALPETNTIPVHVHHLRKQLTALQATVEIETHRGLGYLLLVPKGDAVMFDRNSPVTQLGWRLAIVLSIGTVLQVAWLFRAFSRRRGGLCGCRTESMSCSISSKTSPGQLPLLASPPS